VTIEGIKARLLESLKQARTARPDLSGTIDFLIARL
jgi:hypothetical protein